MLTDFTNEKRARIFSSSFPEHTETLNSNETNPEEVSLGLPPESDLGNVEYKAKLCDLSNERIHHLTTQMKWRLREGQGEAIYEIGVDDDGSLTGIVQSEMDESLKCLHRIAENISASFSVLSQREVSTDKSKEKRYVTEVLVRKVPDSQPFLQVRLAILGSAEVGKSTLCGVLSRGKLDNGKGSARLNIFRYLHEFQSGKTSSVCLDVIGFNSDGELLNTRKNSLDEVVEQSTKLMTLIDLAGDSKYISTTIFGLCGYNPHYCALVVSATQGPTQMTREHACLAMALNIPAFLVITKIDCVDDRQVELVMAKSVKLIQSVGLSGADVQIVSTKEQAISAATALTRDNITPVLMVSSVTGDGMDLLKCFLNVLPPIGLTPIERKALSQKPPFFQIEEIFRVPRVGIVVCGLLTEGVLYVGDRMKIGPTRTGEYQEGRVGSIRRNKQPVFSITPGEAASIAVNFDGQEVTLHRGMVMIAENILGTCCWEFEAKFFLFFHPGHVLDIGFQGTIYIGSLRRTAILVDVASEDKKVRPGSYTTVKFKFVGKPEFVQPGAPLIFRESKTRAMGEVSSVVEIQQPSKKNE